MNTLELHKLQTYSEDPNPAPFAWFSSGSAHCNNTNLKHKRLIEHRVQSFLVHFGVKLLLLVRQQQDFDVRIRGAARVHGQEVGGLQDANCELQAQVQRRQHN